MNSWRPFRAGRLSGRLVGQVRRGLIADNRLGHRGMNIDTQPTDAVGSRGGAGLYLAVLGMMLALYAATTQQGPAWQDSGIFQWRILNFDLAGELGLALAHPLLIMLGKAMSFLPFGPPAFRMNLISAICGAVATANVAMLVRRFSASSISGFLCCLYIPISSILLIT